MAAYNKVNVFTADLTNAKHDFTNHIYKVALTNTAPSAASTVWNVTAFPAPAAANGYAIQTSAITKSNSSGTEKIVAGDALFTATAGGIGPFQYAILYNDTQATPDNPIVAYFDYGSAVTLAVGESFTVDFDLANGLFTIG